ncbi:MAG: hypothetical protein JO325_16610 [Solirubrobacterales bacterium]|nr:hypothetical protein [Solirubrobacterales bacterium]
MVAARLGVAAAERPGDRSFIRIELHGGFLPGVDTCPQIEQGAAGATITYRPA